ncbi:hypothetical protein B0T11DRAFT_285551 [Plectosphaerella cucumerina]|uniref:Uncharacterized protein n=1 Tax=Plectosphaerella cucumerina TaxID=40658 RepID=A0A8K0X286_9PEZI|nr:hypothetical protein B0T11DRAFT_285551 [Plectosphaerella cucumerina]
MSLSTSTEMQEPSYCGPTRLLIDIKDNGVFSFQQAWDEPQKVITRVLTYLGHDRLVSPDDVYNGNNCRFMALDRWDQRIFMLCDLFNADYNFLEANLEGNNELPVVVVKISHDTIRSKKIPQHIGMVGTSLRELHDFHGWEKRPPFSVDHANGAYPTFALTRSTRRE